MSPTEAMRSAHGGFVSSGNLMPGIKILLEAASDGLSEALLVELCCFDEANYVPMAKQVAGVTPNRDSPARRKVRQACTRIGAKFDREEGRWRL